MVETRTLSHEVVRPESRIRLTPSDYDCNGLYGYGIFLFDSSTAASAATMKSSLARVLLEFRQLAGRLSGVNEHPQRGCIVLTDEGVSFEQAMAIGCTVEDVVRTRDFTALLPEVTPNAEELFFAKYTSMECGGAALATAGNHMVVDACAYWNFMDSWAKLARGEALQDGFVMDRTPMMPREPLQFHPGSPKHSEAEAEGGSVAAETGSIAAEAASIGGEVVVRIVSLSKEELDVLKSKSQDPTLSTFECLAGHLWKCAASLALNEHKSKSSSVSIMMNARKLLSVPKSFFGNALTMVCPTCNLQELLNQPSSFAAKRIHDSLRGIKAENVLMDLDEWEFYWRRGKDEWEQYFSRTWSQYQGLFFINSWAGFPMYQCDFGKGRPALVSIAHKLGERSMFIQPGCGNKGLEIHIALPQEHLEIMLGLVKKI